jgi:hypothetical protein
MSSVPLRYWFAGFAIALSAGMFVWLSGRMDLTASQLQALGSSDPQATVFTDPVFVEWTGTVRRSLAGGRGFELTSPDADGGLFFAYDIPESVLPAFVGAGTVRVWGRWVGTSCEYGACGPEMEVDRAEVTISSVTAEELFVASPSGTPELTP